MTDARAKAIEALRPFEREAERWHEMGDTRPLPETHLTVADLRRAAEAKAALESAAPAGGVAEGRNGDAVWAQILEDCDYTEDDVPSILNEAAIIRIDEILAAPPPPEPGGYADLVRRLRGEYRIPITDGLGPAGGDEPDNPHEHVRTYPTPPIQHEAAEAALATERERADRLWDALLWLDTSDPEMIAAAEDRFGLNIRDRALKTKEPPHAG